MQKKVSGLYFITDSRLTKQGILKDAEQAIEAGCRIVQYREKEKSFGERLKEAKQLAGLCRKKGAVFIANDSVEIALAAGADGIHLGKDDMPIREARELLGKEKIIGASTHCVKEALGAENAGADYISVGPIFHTTTKQDAARPVGVELLKKVKAKVKLPIVAIGGINQENLPQVLVAGPDAIAMISGLLCSNDLGKAARKAIELIGGTNGKH